jgi:hypothetical protein
VIRRALAVVAAVLALATPTPAADPPSERYADLARVMVEDATWVFLLQLVDIYAIRDRVTWTPRADQWMLFHAATLK